MRGSPAERFLTTVVFTDIVGSTELAAELGDRAWRDLVQEHNTLVRAALRRHGGREIDTAGDGFFAIFDAPAAAVGCALEISRAVGELGLRIRAGIHAGEVEQIGKKVGGLAVPIGARIMGMAGPGEVLVSSTIRDLTVGAGYAFRDRGHHELRGVPGDWQLLEVLPGATRIAEGSVPASDLPERDRRAAAVRRAQARPLWRRHPRTSGGLVLGLVAVVAVAGLLAWAPWRPRALAAIPENAVGVIDPARNEIVGQAALGRQPGAIAMGEGAVWITNPGSDTISRIDPLTRAVIDTIEVGKAPAGVAVGGGSVWVANSGSRSVSRINAAASRVVDTIEVGNGPRAIAFGAGAIWVANSGDGTVSRIDPATGQADPPWPATPLPSAIAADESGVWVASEDRATVVRLDPATGAPLTQPIGVGSRPLALIIAAGGVWVSNASSGTVSRIDPVTNAVDTTIPLGNSPLALAASDQTLWVADGGGLVHRIDLAARDAKPTPIPTGSAPQAIVAVGEEIWFTTRAAAASHRGGTVRVVAQFYPIFEAPGYQELLALYADGLVGYPRLGGPAGTRLVPILATAIPVPTDGGLSYAFRLRPGIRYSDGSAVQASHFRSSLERIYEVSHPDLGPIAPGYFDSLVGIESCAEPPVDDCDLSSGIVADDAAGTITYRLSRPDSDFLYKLAAMPFVVPPDSVPPDELATQPFPTTGAYAIASIGANEVHLVRNAHFQSPDPREHPEGFADEIIWTSEIEPADQVRMVASGAADYMADQIPPDAFAELRTRYTAQLHVGTGTTTYTYIDTTVPPFDRLEVRQALAFAIDRSHVVDLRGGPGAAEPTCQVLPPNFQGYEPYCPFTRDPGPTGRWSAPDLDRARELVTRSGTAGATLTVGPYIPRLDSVGEYIAGLLRDLGYDADYRPSDTAEAIFAMLGDGGLDFGAFEWFADYPAPATFLSQFTCDESRITVNYCDPTLEALIEDAYALQVVDPAAGARKWADVDRAVTDLALWVPLVNEGSDFVSTRVGNYQFNTAIGILLDQVWVK